MKKLLLLPLLLLTALARAGMYTAPLVDLDSRLTGTTASMAVWTNARVAVSSNAEVTITFPAGFNLGSFSPATCQCVFMKYTNSASGSFSPSEVTVTAGHLNGQDMEVHLPGDIYPGPLYIRLDPTALVTNPPQAGTLMLVLKDSNDAPVTSRSFRILNSLTDTDPPQAVISGFVRDPAGKPISGAIVVASTTAISSVPNLTFGPGLSGAAAMGAGEEMLMAVSGQNGDYSLTAPYTTAGTSYYVQANYTIRTASNLLTYQTNTATVQVSSANLAVNQDLPQQTQVLSTPLN